MGVPSTTVRTLLIDTQTATTAAGSFDCAGNVYNLRFDVVGVGTVSSGVITLECAHDKNYTGTWSTLTTVTASDVTGGAVKSIFVAGVFDAVRARISTTVTGSGGAVSVRLTGN